MRTMLTSVTILSLALLNCHDRPGQGQLPAPEVAKPQTVLRIPDHNTYFPLTPGSCWYYVAISEGDGQAEYSELDSVILLEKQPSCYAATVLRYFGPQDSVPDTMYYQVDSNDNVHRRFNSDTYELCAFLFPDTLKSTLGEYRYVERCADGCYKYCTFNWDLIDRQDTVVWDTTYSEPYYSWKFAQFERGIGQTSAGMSDTYSQLKYYRIGPDTTRREYTAPDVESE